MSINVSLLTKTYKAQKALDTISFSAEKGEVIGFLGPNGAGKSTMMKILTGYLKPNEGTVAVNGIDILKNPIKAQKNIGYLPEHNPLYKDMFVKEYLQFQAAIFKVDTSLKLKDNDAINTVIKKVGLTAEAHKKIHQLSKGYQQRVGLAAAILHNPSVLILDEPTTGLDPNQLLEIRALIKELGKDKTVLFSTHIMQEVEAVCGRVIIIKKGKILVDKALQELQQHKKQIIKVIFSSTIDKALLNTISENIELKNIQKNTWEFTFENTSDMRPVVFSFAKKNNLEILELSATSKNLENIFQELTV